MRVLAEAIPDLTSTFEKKVLRAAAREEITEQQMKQILKKLREIRVIVLPEEDERETSKKLAVVSLQHQNDD